MPKRTVDLRERTPLLDIVSYGRRARLARDSLSLTGLRTRGSAAHRAPEVMVKVTGGGTTISAVASHMRYVDRNGSLRWYTDDDDQQLQGRGCAEKLLNDWDLESRAMELRSPYSGKPGRRAAKLVHNIVLSMPEGTSATGVLRAGRAFIREAFAGTRRYALVQHTDRGHPHLHVVVSVVGERGEHLAIRKATLRQWREQFAQHLREQGIQANATARARPEAKSRCQKGGRFWTAWRAGVPGMQRREASAIGRLHRIQPGASRPGTTRRAATDKNAELVREVRAFVESMQPAMTDREQLAAPVDVSTHSAVRRTIGMAR